MMMVHKLTNKGVCQVKRYQRLTITLLGAGMLAFGSNALFSMMAHGSTRSVTDTQVQRDAMSAIKSFFHAQKVGDVPGMMSVSDDIQANNVSELKAMYQQWCNQRQQIATKVTNIKLVDSSLALASVDTTYRDMVTVSCFPVYKMNGQWKVITGIPMAGYIPVSGSSQQLSQTAMEVRQALQSFYGAEKTGNVDQAMSYILFDMRSNNTEQIKQQLTHMFQSSRVIEESVTDIHVIGDNLAVASVEGKTDNSISVGNVLVYRVNDQWKVITGIPGGGAIPVA